MIKLQKEDFIEIEKDEGIGNISINIFFKKTCALLKKTNFYDELDYFHTSINIKCQGDLNSEIPTFKWIVVYVVVGGSEGYYIHVDIVSLEGIQEPLFIGKAWTIDTALEVSNLLTKAYNSIN